MTQQRPRPIGHASRRIALDSVTEDGRAFHERVADPRAADESDDDGNDDSAPYCGPDATSRVPELLAAITTAHDLDRLAAATEALGREQRREADRAASLADTLVRAMRVNDTVMARMAEGLIVLSAQQLAIVSAIDELVNQGELPTRRAVGRLVGISHRAVTVQWGRIKAKLTNLETCRPRVALPPAA